MTQEQFFNRYKYDTDTDSIGEGGFGKVFKAFDETRNRHVAIKVSEVRKGQESLSLMKEVDLAASLPENKNVAHYEACYRFKTPFGTFDYGILQYYPLGNLTQLVRSKKLSDGEKERIGLEIISGIKHLHRNNIVHRDLKSSNILIAKGYRGEYVPKIADFGLSKQFTENDKSYFSNSFAGGSLLYVAPEQLEGKELRKNVDLWSLGVVLFELFTGETPFKASVDDGTETARAEIISKIKNASIPASISTIPSKWQEIIRGCLVTDPTRRVKSIEDVLAKVGMSSGTTLDTEIDKKKTKDTDNKTTESRPTPSWLYYLIGGIALSVAAIMGIRSCGGEGKSSGLVVFEDQDLYGYKDATGDIIIPARYETASPFSNGRAKVSVSDSVYYIDEGGLIMELIKPREDSLAQNPSINEYETLNDRFYQDFEAINNNISSIKIKEKSVFQYYGDVKHLSYSRDRKRIVAYFERDVYYGGGDRPSSIKVYDRYQNKLIFDYQLEEVHINFVKLIENKLIFNTGNILNIIDIKSNLTTKIQMDECISNAEYFPLSQSKLIVLLSQSILLYDVDNQNKNLISKHNLQISQDPSGGCRGRISLDNKYFYISYELGQICKRYSLSDFKYIGEVHTGGLEPPYLPTYFDNCIIGTKNFDNIESFGDCNIKVSHDNTVSDLISINNDIFCSSSVDRSVACWSKSNGKKIDSYSKKGVLSYAGPMDIDRINRTIIVGSLYGRFIELSY